MYSFDLVVISPWIFTMKPLTPQGIYLWLPYTTLYTEFIIMPRWLPRVYNLYACQRQLSWPDVYYLILFLSTYWYRIVYEFFPDLHVNLLRHSVLLTSSFAHWLPFDLSSLCSRVSHLMYQSIIQRHIFQACTCYSFDLSVISHLRFYIMKPHCKGIYLWLLYTTLYTEFIIMPR